MIDGLLLAGGRSRRFGSDKRLVRVNGRTLFEISFAALRGAVDGTVFVAAGAGRKGLACGGRGTFVADAAPGGGPLAGIVAGLRRAQSGILVAPCDAPHLTTRFLDRIARHAREHGRMVAFRSEGHWEPLIAFYPVAALTTLEAALNQRRLALHRLLQDLDCAALSGSGEGHLVNINRRRDLEKVSSRQQGRR